MLPRQQSGSSVDSDTPRPPVLSRLHWSLPLVFGCIFFLIWIKEAAPTTLLDPDTYLHITIGDWILSNHRIPVSDFFSHTKFGSNWIAHEWLADVILASIYACAGWTGLHLATVGLCAFSLAYICRFQLNRGVEPIYALYFTILATAGALNHLLTRPHILTWPILVIWFAQIIRASEQQRTPPYRLLALLVLWVNLHGSFVIGIGLLVVMGVDTIVASPGRSRIKVARSWGIYIGLALAMTLANPYGWQSLTFVYQLLTQTGLHYIDEWRPANFSALTGLEVWILTLVGLMALGLLRLSVVRTALVILLMHEALAHVRYISIFSLLIPLLIATPFQKQYRERMQDAPQNASVIDQLMARFALPAKPLVIAGTSLLALICGYAMCLFINPRPPEKYAPVAAIEAARGAGLEQQPVFNDYSYGGYLISQGIPVFIDGRADMYGDDFLKDYFEANDPDRMQQLPAFLDKHRIEWTLLPSKHYMTETLDRNPSWQALYRDETSTVHQRVKTIPH